MNVSIKNGHVLEELAKLPADSVHCVVTSPPYWGLRDYGIPPTTWGGDVECAHEFEVEELKTEIGRGNWAQGVNGRGEIQPGGVDSARKPIEGLSRRGYCRHCGAWLGVLGLEPDYREFVDHMAEVFEAVRRVLRPDGTLWMNLGDSYATDAGKVGERPGGGARGDKWAGELAPGLRGRKLDGARFDTRAEFFGGKLGIGPITQPNRLPQAGLKAKDLVGMPWRVALALQAAGWYLRSDIIWHKPNPQPESVDDRPTKSHEYVFLLSKSERYYYDSKAVEEPLIGGAPTGRGKNRRTVWTVAPESYPGAHFATYPPELVRLCILAGCPVGGTVLDPFAGSGTTLEVARSLDCDAVGIELNPEYCRLIEARLAQECLLMGRESTGNLEVEASTQITFGY